jgi:hypothetical protein
LEPFPRARVLGVSEMEPWWEAFGITLDASAVSIERRSAGGVQAIAARDLQEGEIVARIPRAALLNEDTTAAAALAKELRAAALWGGRCACGRTEGVASCRSCGHDQLEAIAAWRDKMVLSFILMFERALGPASAFAAYLASIPPHEPIPLLWPAECRQWLAGTEAAAPAIRDREGARCPALPHSRAARAPPPATARNRAPPRADPRGRAQGGVGGLCRAAPCAARGFGSGGRGGAPHGVLRGRVRARALARGLADLFDGPTQRARGRGRLCPDACATRRPLQSRGR